VKVVLNGHGSDEMLGGYPRKFVAPFLAGLLLAGHPAECARQCRLFGAYGVAARHLVLSDLTRAILPECVKPALRRVLALAPSRRRPRNDSVFEPPPHPPAPWHGAAASIRSPHDLSPLNSALWSQFTSTVLPRWLRMEDRMSMAWSIESRLPFMDYRLVEFVFNLPDRMKLNDGQTKYILRKAMWDRLPEQIVRTTAKRCFGTPYPEWLRGAWGPMIEDLLLSGPCHVQPYLQPRFRAQLRNYLGGREGPLNAGTLWRVLNTELWLRRFAAAGRAA
jgi:asparagine synthase (glutamine-hydrolysing)